MIIGIGTDIIEIARVAKAWERKGQRFVCRICSPKEAELFAAMQSDRSCSKAQLERMAARFACKEAVMKALGTGWRHGVAWNEIEILHRPSGQPYVNLLGRTKEISREKGIVEIQVSMSHDNERAVAFAIALGEIGGVKSGVDFTGVPE